jgi:hypothetical protein
MGEDSRPKGIVPPERRTPEESSIKKYFLGVWIIFWKQFFGLSFIGELFLKYSLRSEMNVKFWNLYFHTDIVWEEKNPSLLEKNFLYFFFKKIRNGHSKGWTWHSF